MDANCVHRQTSSPYWICKVCSDRQLLMQHALLCPNTMQDSWHMWTPRLSLRPSAIALISDSCTITIPRLGAPLATNLPQKGVTRTPEHRFIIISQAMPPSGLSHVYKGPWILAFIHWHRWKRTQQPMQISIRLSILSIYIPILIFNMFDGFWYIYDFIYRTPQRNCPPFQKGSEGGPWRSRHVRERAGLQALRSLGNLVRAPWWYHMVSPFHIQNVNNVGCLIVITPPIFFF